MTELASGQLSFSFSFSTNPPNYFNIRKIGVWGNLYIFDHLLYRHQPGPLLFYPCNLLRSSACPINLHELLLFYYSPPHPVTRAYNSSKPRRPLFFFQSLLTSMRVVRGPSRHCTIAFVFAQNVIAPPISVHGHNGWCVV